MNSKELLSIRLNLRKTQKEMAELLGTSLRSIQSFEQGWRRIPNEIERQVLYVLVMKSTKEHSLEPCWELENCPLDKREHCPAWELESGHLCWFVNGTVCKGRAYSNWGEKMEICRECQVFQPVQQLYDKATTNDLDELKASVSFLRSGDEVRIGKSEKWRSFDIFDQVPTCLAVIDRKYSIIDANKSFVKTFGPWEEKKCFEAYKGRKRRCRQCVASQTFMDGRTRTSQEVGRDMAGDTHHYLVHVSPYRDFEGNITHIIEMSTDITEKVEIQSEYRTIFDNVPCYITVIDRNFQIVKSNKYFQKIFGKDPATFCFESYKKNNDICDKCPAQMVFSDGRTHRSLQEGYDKKGNKVQYMVTATPYSKKESQVDYVIEMALDVTETVRLKGRLKEILEFNQSVIQHALDGIIASNKDGIIDIYNPSAKKLLKYPTNKVVGKMPEEDICPKDFLGAVNGLDETVVLQESKMLDYKGNHIPVVLSGTKLRKDDQDMGSVMFFQDLSKIEQLEADILEAERLAAVGETVAGLAHGMKNVLMGLEGGMYVVNSGKRRGDNELAHRGWEMLQNNIEKISDFVKEFMNFARRTNLQEELTDPRDIAVYIENLYKDKVEQSGILFVTNFQEGIKKVPMDVQGIHTCVANLLSNAIDACMVSDKKKTIIWFSLFEKNSTVYYEVKDNGSGMDYEVKKKIFTSFFTTKKSGQGTGLGLLTTKKIVHEHGGKIFFESILGKGSKFRLEFPINRLPVVNEKGDNS